MSSGNDDTAAAEPAPGTRINPSMAIIVVVLIGACLVVVILSMYLKKCMQRGDDDGGGIRRRTNQSIRFYDRPGEGLDKAVIDRLPTVSFSVVKTLKHGKEDLECAVCLESFDDDEPLRLLPQCSHVFHTDCIDAWFLSHSTCPLCRTCLKLADVGEVSRRILEAQAQEELLFSSARMGSDIGTVVGEGESGRDIDGGSVRNTMLRKLHQNSNSFKRAARGVKIQERVMALSARYASESTDHDPEAGPQSCIHLSLQRTTSTTETTLDFWSHRPSAGRRGSLNGRETPRSSFGRLWSLNEREMSRSSFGRLGSLNEREMSRSSFGRLGSLNERETPEEEAAEGVELSPKSLEKPQAGAWEQRVRRERAFSRSASGPLERRNDHLQHIVIE